MTGHVGVPSHRAHKGVRFLVLQHAVNGKETGQGFVVREATFGGAIGGDYRGIKPVKEYTVKFYADRLADLLNAGRRRMVNGRVQVVRG